MSKLVNLSGLKIALESFLSLFDNKVDKVNGKGLSTNDLTNTLKSNYDSAYTHSTSGHAPVNAEANQNAFSNIAVGSTTIAADSKTDTLNLVAGDNITITPDAANDKITIEAVNTVYTHPSYTARTGVPTDNQTPSFGEAFEVSQPVSDKTGHITAINTKTVTLPNNTATTTADGLMSSSDKSKLNGIATGANKTTVDSALSTTSTNPVQNKVVTASINTLNDLVGNTSVEQQIGNAITDQKGKATGLAELDANGKVPTSQLPSYVDDVLEYASKSSFPSTGETGKIYVDTATNKTYRWSGSAYVEISASLALGETSSTAYRGDRGKTAYDHASAKGSAFNSGLYKITTNDQGHVTAVADVVKSDITALGIPAQDTTYNEATITTNGLMSNVDKAKFDVTNVAYGKCVTAAGTAVKEVTTAGNTNWKLATGSMVTVAFSATNTAQNPTLNVNGTGAKPIKYQTAIVGTSNLERAGRANIPITYMYDGTYYKFIAWGYDENTDTKNTTGSTNTSEKIYLVGATSQATNPQTYSHDTVYVDTSGRLVSNDFVTGNTIPFFTTGYKGEKKSYTFPQETSKTYYVKLKSAASFEEQKFLLKTQGNNTQYMICATIGARPYMGATIYGQTLRYNGSEITEIAVYKNTTTTYTHDVVLKVKTNPSTQTVLDVYSNGAFDLSESCISTTAPTGAVEASFIPNQTDKLFTTSPIYAGQGFIGDLEGNATSADAANVQLLEEGTDLNTIKEAGYYGCRYSETGTSLINSPLSSLQTGVLLKVYNIDETIYQEISGIYSGSLWKRRYAPSSQVWSDWIQNTDTAIVLEEGTDLNTIVNDGIYVQSQSAKARTLLNNPLSNISTGILLKVYKGNSNIVYQELHGILEGSIYKRRCNSSDWTEWTKLTTTTDVDNAIYRGNVATARKLYESQKLGSNGGNTGKYALLAEYKVTGNYNGIVGTYSFIDAESSYAGIFNVKIRTSNSPTKTSHAQSVWLSTNSATLGTSLVITQEVAADSTYSIYRLYYHAQTTYHIPIIATISETKDDSCEILSRPAYITSYVDNYTGTFVHRSTGDIANKAATATKATSADTASLASKLTTVQGVSSSTNKVDKYALLTTYTISATWAGYHGIIAVVDKEGDFSGIFDVKARTGSNKGTLSTSLVRWLSLNRSTVVDSLMLTQETDATTGNCVVRLYWKPHNAGITPYFATIYENGDSYVTARPTTVSSYTDTYLGTLATTSTADSAINAASAAKADKLSTARTIALSGGATGTATSFDGSQNITIPVTAISPNKISSGYTGSRWYVNMSPENSGVIIPYLFNDFAHLTKRGGTAVIKYDGVEASTDLSVLFNGSMDYLTKTLGDIKTVTVELTLPTPLTYSQVLYVDSYATTYRAKNITLEVRNSNFADDPWTIKSTITDNAYAQHYSFFNHTPVGGAQSNGFNQVRYTFSNFAGSTFRLSCIGTSSRSKGLEDLCLSKKGGDVYGNITPYTAGTLAIGSEDKKFNLMYANQFIGILKGGLKSVDASAKSSYTQNLTYFRGVTPKGSATDRTYCSPFGNYADSNNNPIDYGSLIRLSYESKYYTDIWADANYKSGLVYRQVINGTSQPWKTILDSSNYSNYIQAATDDEILALMQEMGEFPLLTDESGNIYTDENEAILLI